MSTCDACDCRRYLKEQDSRTRSTRSRHRYHFISRWRSAGSCLKIESSSTPCVAIHLYLKNWLMRYRNSSGSVTSSPLPSTLELGSTYAVEKLIAIWAMKNMSRKDRRQVSIMARWWSIVIHNWRSLPSTVGRKKKRGSMKWEATHETRKTRFHISTALPPGSSILSSRFIQILEKSFNLSTILLLIVLTEPVAKLFCLSLASFSIRLSLQSKKSIKTYTI